MAGLADGGAAVFAVGGGGAEPEAVADGKEVRLIPVGDGGDWSRRV